MWYAGFERKGGRPVDIVMLTLFLSAFALAGTEEPARYGWLWIPAALGTGYLVLTIVAVLRPQSFPTKMREKLLGTEPRRKG